MPNKDNDLLARLNALKPSSLSLDPADPIIDVQTSSPQTVEDKLAERLKVLRSGGTSAPITSPHVVKSQRPPVGETVARVEDDVAVERDPIRNWQQQSGEEQSVEDLLAELEADGEWRLGAEEPKSVEALLKEARDALPRDGGGESGPSSQDSELDNGKENTQADGDLHHDSSSENEDNQDETDADDYIARVLAELDIEKKYGGGEDEESDPEQQSSTSPPSSTIDGLNLPSTPSQLKPLPPTSDPAEPPTYEDSQLEARFSALSTLDLLPSTPTTQPSSSKPKITASLKKPTSKSNLPVYTNEEIDSWCCICNEDGELRCLGCDGDLYCQECWKDGHGEGVGKERGHRAVVFSRKGTKRAAVA